MDRVYLNLYVYFIVKCQILFFYPGTSAKGIKIHYIVCNIFNPSDTETWVFWYNESNDIAIDDLLPWIARTSAVMEFTMIL